MNTCISLSGSLSIRFECIGEMSIQIFVLCNRVMLSSLLVIWIERAIAGIFLGLSKDGILDKSHHRVLRAGPQSVAQRIDFDHEVPLRTSV